MAVTVISLVLGACAGPRLMVQPVAVPQDPAAAMMQLESKLVEGRQNQLNVLSPTWFAKAEGSLAEARKVQKGKGEISRMEGAASRGLTEISQAEEIGRIARSTIPKAIEGRRLARTAGATSFGEDYAAAERRFRGLTRDVENNNLKGAKRDQQGVVEAFRTLEIRAIKETILGDTRKVLTQADNEGARKWAPALYTEVQQDLAGVEKFIASNPYAREEMQQRGNVVLFKANRLLQINRQATHLRETKPLETTLWIEGILSEATEALGAPDMRDKAFHIQVGNIVGSINALVKDRDYLVQKTDAQQEAMDTMRSRYPEEIESLKKQSREEAAEVAKLLKEQEAEQARLEAERRFNELYNEVQALFTRDEAECYKQGNRMVIRLRGMTFPVGQAVIMPDNYPLLSKVQRAMRTFTEPQVTIQGHTDSTGTAEFNDHLSQQRAESVKKYLLANNVLREDQMAGRLRFQPPPGPQYDGRRQGDQQAHRCGDHPQGNTRKVRDRWGSGRLFRTGSLTPKPQTSNLKPQTSNPKPQTPNLKHQTPSLRQRRGRQGPHRRKTAR
jgi:outer membrane protein OmpA-like peptidoglycan-associated protein